ncbi:nucleotide pyrophosphohydrolase [Candidatus Microgenomates bacterium]|nr:nucleotide pyrophosphohydrolase [Candidatus Microgenomates bacterium]
MLRVSEEVGELAREVNHRFGSKPKKPTEPAGDLGEEISGIIFALICLANSQGIDLDKAWAKEMSKYAKRDNQRFKKRI